jgi:hypothetical protein
VSKDRPITGRHLLRHEAEPGGKVASFGKGSAVGNGRNHRTWDERTDAWNRHQLPATLAPVCQLFDLLGNALDALIESYRETRAWTNLSPATRRQREGIFAHVLESRPSGRSARLSRPPLSPVAIARYYSISGTTVPRHHARFVSLGGVGRSSEF